MTFEVLGAQDVESMFANVSNFGLQGAKSSYRRYCTEQRHFMQGMAPVHGQKSDVLQFTEDGC